MKLIDLRVENMVCPIGIDVHNPAFGYKIISQKRDVRQVSYSVLVREEEGEVIWDTGKVYSEQTLFIRYKGCSLKSLHKYVVAITCENNYGERAEAVTCFETGFLENPFANASWIEPDQNPAFHECIPVDREKRRKRLPIEDIKMEPARYIRRIFQIIKAVRKARIYITAHGVYKFEVNGVPVEDQELAPGNSTYPQYLFYQTYDITRYLKPGVNCLGIIVGDGWYCGKVGLTGASCSFGDRLAVIFEIHIWDEDNNEHIIGSDGTCKSAAGPILYSDIFVGEKYDARLQVPFSKADFTDSEWSNVTEAGYDKSNLHAQYGEPVRIIKRFHPAEIIRTPGGEIVLDTGQVLAGRVKMSVRGERGSKIMLEHSEILSKEGDFLNNLHGRFSQQTDVYIMRGGEEESYTPSFTFHGFRYVRITGYPGMPTVDDFEIQVLSSDNRQTVQFSCSDTRLNRLWENVIWSQRSNSISIPTDCPQREKAGWTGDVSVFAATACINMDMYTFFKRWLLSVRADQLKDGQIPIIVPFYPSYNMNILHPGTNAQCSAGWGDVILTLPYALYKTYGDEEILREYYPCMKAWVNYIEKTAKEEIPKNLPGTMTPERRQWQKYLWNTNFHYGDWLTPSVSFDFEKGTIDMMKSAEMTMDIIPTCFYAYSAQLLAKIAFLLKKEEDGKYYLDLSQKVKKAFFNEFTDDRGIIKSNLQGVYVLALAMEILPEEKRHRNLERLLELIHNNGDKLDTGFLSMPFLLGLLESSGEGLISYNLLFQDECPSWLYEIKMGATTIWEAWQAVMPDGTPKLCSYNHYAFGCVAEWMYQNIGGIRQAAPGYKKICIAPALDGRISNSSIIIESVHGTISNEWSIEDGRMRMKVRIPSNTSAVIILPYAAGRSVYENGIPLMTAASGRDGILTVGSGDYEFEYLLKNE